MKFRDWNHIRIEEVTSSLWKKSLDGDTLAVSRAQLLDGCAITCAIAPHRTSHAGAAGRIARTGSQ